MKKSHPIQLSFILLLLLSSCSGNNKKDYPIKQVPIASVVLTDNLWKPAIERNLKVTMPYVMDHLASRQRVAGSGTWNVIEGIAYYLMINKNPELETLADTLISRIKASQQEDGDLGGPHHNVGQKSVSDSLRWLGTDDFGETGGSPRLWYGHLYEAAVAYYNATGKTSLLEVAEKNARLLLSVFGPGKLETYPYHPEIELALVKLYQATGKSEYLRLSKFFLDVRGPNGTEYSQSHKKIVDQTEAIGHAVRALYLYSGITDIVALTGDKAYKKAIDSIWNSLVGSKFYITGGVGSYADHEAIGPAFSLPNVTAYNETCASIANIFWCNRMFRLNGDARYIDVMERTLYNSLLDGVSVSGDRFFYPNPLASCGEYQRASWYGVPCCPPNLVRFLPQIPGYLYAAKNNDLFVNLFISSTGKIEMPSGTITIRQETDYPWQGTVKLMVDPDKISQFNLRIRIPGWANRKPVPSDLYRFMDESKGEVRLTLNGEPFKYNIENGYAIINRNWSKGDVVILELPMEVRKIIASDKVEDDRGRFAIQRGPVVYCLEGWDNTNGHVQNIMIPADATFKPGNNPKGLPNGTFSLVTSGTGLNKHHQSDVLKNEQEITAIPYYLWANRGSAEMEVWIPYEESKATPLLHLESTIALSSKISSSYDTTTLSYINDQAIIPYNQNIPMNRYYRWPMKDTIQWVQYKFKKNETVSSSQVYWYDNEPSRMTTWYNGVPWTCCRVPESWELLYLDGSGKWKPVINHGQYGIEKNMYNEVKFEPVNTRSLKMIVKKGNKACANGLQEWIVK